MIHLFPAVWVRDGTKSQAVMEIGKKLKDKLKIGPRNVILFQLHKDLYKPSSTTKAIYTLWINYLFIISLKQYEFWFLYLFIYLHNISQ